MQEGHIQAELCFGWTKTSTMARKKRPSDISTWPNKAPVYINLGHLLPEKKTQGEKSKTTCKAAAIASCNRLGILFFEISMEKQQTVQPYHPWDCNFKTCFRCKRGSPRSTRYASRLLHFPKRNQVTLWQITVPISQIPCKEWQNLSWWVDNPIDIKKLKD